MRKSRKLFDEKYAEYSAEEIQKEILWFVSQNTFKTERVRKNTQAMVNFLVIPTIIAIAVYLLFTLQSLS